MKETMTDAMRVAGKILMEYFNKPLTHTRKESQSSIVTEADFASDAAIKEIIKTKYPGHNILSEETGFVDNSSEYTWIIDPLDGTSNFASGIPWFGVLLSLFRGNIPVMGGAYLPVTDTMYIAEKGLGSYRNNERIPELAGRSLKDSLFSFCVDYTDDAVFLGRGLDIYRQLVLSSRNIRSTNCLIDFIYVAEGKFGGVLNLFTRIWDIAGLSVIIEEAGGIMQRADGTNLEFTISDETSGVNFPVLAGNRQVMETLRKDILEKINYKF